MADSPPPEWAEQVAAHIRDLFAPRTWQHDSVEAISVEVDQFRLRVVVRVAGAADPVGLTRDLRNDWAQRMTDAIAVAANHYWDAQSPIDTSTRPLVHGARWWGDTRSDPDPDIRASTA